MALTKISGEVLQQPLNVGVITANGINNTGVSTATAYTVSDITVIDSSRNLSVTAGIFSGSSSNDLVRITQTGSGNAFVVEDAANPDATPFAITTGGNVAIGTVSPNSNAVLDIAPAASATVRIHSRTDVVPVTSLELLTGENEVWGANTYADYRFKNDSVDLSLEYGKNGSSSEVIRWFGTGEVGIGTSVLVGSSKLQVGGGLYVSGITTFSVAGVGTVSIGVGTTALLVDGNARVTGILTVGNSSITLDGSNNQVNVGTGVTLHHTNGVQVGGNTLHSSGLTLNTLNVGTGGTVITTTVGGNVGINQNNPSKAKLHVVGPSSSTQEIIAKFKGGSGTDAESRIALVAAYSDTNNDTEGHVYLTARRNGNGNSTSFSVYCADNASTMTERLKVTNSGDIYLNGSNGSHKVVDEYAGYVSVTNSNNDAFAFRIMGNSLGGGGKLYLWGTSGNVVVNVSADIIISHSTHIAVQSISNGYTQARIRIVTDSNERGDVFVGRYGGYPEGTTQLNWRFIPYGETYVLLTAGNYSNSTITHITNSNSYTISATSGGNVNASGSKNFLIDHPLVGLSTTTKLAHAAVEGPECNTMYRGKVDLVDGTATVNIDTNSRMTEGTFEALNQNVQCYTTNETGWTAVKGSISGNLLTVIAQDNTCTDTVSWLVVAERKDQTMINSDMTDSEGRLIPELIDKSNDLDYPEYPDYSEPSEKITINT